MKTRGQKLHIKLTILYTAFALVMGILIIVFGYFVMQNLAVDFYGEKAQHAAALAAAQVNGDSIERYAATLETDAAYEDLRASFNEMKEKQDLTYLYIFVPKSDHFVYILEAVASQDPPDYLGSALGSTYDYTDNEYTYLVPDVQAKRASQEVIRSTNMFVPDGSLADGVSAWAPVLNSEGEVAAMVEADIMLSKVLASIRQSVFLMVIVYALLILGMILFQMFTIRRMITNPIRKLTDRTLAFANEGQLLDVADEIKTGDELQTLSEAFGQMARDIITYSDEKADLAAVQERISTELTVAGDLRRSMLPEALPDFPGKRYLSLQGQLKMSEQVGGDFYDYFLLDDHRVGIVLCGMESTGIPAAMLLVVVRTIIKSQFSIERDLDETMSEINRQIYGVVDGKTPISAFIGIMDTDTGVFSYINASYDPPIVMRQGERYEYLVSQSYSALGLTENVSYRILKLELRQDDRLMFYSKGIIGAKSLYGDTFGPERLRICLNDLRNKDLGPASMQKSLMDSVEKFMNGARSNEDLVLLTLAYLRGSRDQAKLLLPPDMSQISVLQDFLKEQMTINHITGRDYAEIQVCAEELFAICCKYAAGDRISVECAVPTTERLVLRFTADLRNSDPLSDHAGQVVQNAIAFVRRIAQSLTLEHESGLSVLVMTKILDR